MHPSPDVLALLALGEEAGTPAERAHVGTCPQCQTEVAELSRAVTAGRAGRTGESDLVTPPDRVWTAIRAELGFRRPSAEPDSGAHEPSEVTSVTAQPRPARVRTNGLAPDEPVAEAPKVAAPARDATVSDLDRARTRSVRGRRGIALLAAAAVALVLGVGLGIGIDRILPRQTVLWTAQLQAKPNFTGSTGEAIVQEDSRGRRTLKIEVESPEPVDGSREVWLIDRSSKKMRHLGALAGSSGLFTIPPDLDPRQFPVVDVSKEPPNDVDLRHSGVSIVQGTLNV